MCTTETNTSSSTFWPYQHHYTLQLCSLGIQAMSYMQVWARVFNLFSHWNIFYLKFNQFQWWQCKSKFCCWQNSLCTMQPKIGVHIGNNNVILKLYYDICWPQTTRMTIIYFDKIHIWNTQILVLSFTHS